MSKKEVRWEDAQYGKYLYTPYNEELINKIKYDLPYDCREWKKEKKAWFIAQEWVPDVEVMIREAFGYE